MSERKVIGVCTCGISAEYNDIICNEIIEYAKQLGNVRVVFYTSFLNKFENTSSDIGEMSVFNLINYDILDGIILLAQTMKDNATIDKIISKAKQHNIKAVCFDYETDKCSDIVFDAARATYDLTNHLIEKHNCSKINFMAGYKRDLLSILRSNAYMKALSEHNIPVDRSRIGEGFWWTFTAEEACRKWIDDKIDFDAVVCANDVMAISVMKALAERGIRVPQDVKVVGLDNLVEGRYHKPSITTGDFCHAKAAREAIDIVLGFKEEGSYVKYSELCFRESCGCENPNESLDMNGYHRKLSTRLDDCMSDNEKMFNLTSKIIEQVDVNNAFSYIEKYLQELWVTKMWVCVNRDLVEENVDFEQDFDDVRALPKTYSKYAKVIASKNNDRNDTDANILVKELCPDFDKVLDECTSIMVFPLHINDNIFGYIVKEHSNNYTMEKWHSLAMNISTALLAVKQQNDMKLANRRLEEMYIRDSMTKIYNRRGFFRMLKRYMMTSPNKKMIVISVDLDGLKRINDSYGHLEGDNAINITAQTLVKSAGDEHICARFGGDEFIISGPYDEDFDFEDKFKRLIDEYNQQSKKPYAISASIGYVIKDCESFKDFDELIRLADEKMYIQKSNNHDGNTRGNSRN